MLYPAELPGRSMMDSIGAADHKVKQPGPRLRGLHPSGLSILCLAVLTGVGTAAAGPLSSPGCMHGGEAAEVASATPDFGLKLADGRDMLLAGIDPWRPAGDPAVLKARADARLLARRQTGARQAALGPAGPVGPPSGLGLRCDAPFPQRGHGRRSTGLGRAKRSLPPVWPAPGPMRASGLLGAFLAQERERGRGDLACGRRRAMR